ncbi:MAG: alginate export family protein [Fimbriimonadaceae bacterium]|nr:alginate export family protein [Fimbriimonadaceae bacterium]
MDQTPKFGAWEIKPTFEHRTRWERRLDRDFLKSNNDNRTDWLFRNRLGFIAKDKDGNKVVVQYQYAYNDYWINLDRDAVQNSDVTLLNWEFKIDDWTVTLGRQGYKLGDGRLFSSLGGWGNLGRTFEGARIRNQEWEFAGFKEAVNTPINREVFTAVAANKNKAGLTSVIYKSDGKTAQTTSHFTLNHLYKQKDKQTDVTLEGAVQSGRVNGRSHEAWAVTANVGYRPHKNLRLYAEASISSGGSGPTSTTFDQIYHNSNFPFGIGPLIGYRNTKEYILGACWQPNKKLKVDGIFSVVELYDKTDGWYNFSGAVNKRFGGSFVDPTGNSGSKVGQFFQLEVAYDANARDSFAGGFAIFEPGGFVKNLVGPGTVNQTWFYLQYNFKF